MGTNTTQMHNNETVAGTTIWREPSMMASRMDLPASR